MCVKVRVCTRVCKCVYVHACMCARVDVCDCDCVYVCMCAHTHMYAWVCVHVCRHLPKPVCYSAQALRLERSNDTGSKAVVQLLRLPATYTPHAPACHPRSPCACLPLTQPMHPPAPTQPMRPPGLCTPLPHLVH